MMGFSAVVTLGNTQNTDILCSNVEGTRIVHIQVKTYMPERARWQNLKDAKHVIVAELKKATEAIEEHNPMLEGVLVSIDFNIKNNLNDSKPRDLLSHYSNFRLRTEVLERPDHLGAAYEYLIKIFTDSTGMKGGEFYTSSEVVKLLVSLLKPHAGLKVYDFTCGSSGELIQTRN